MSGADWPPAAPLRIGVDVGGTNTDAVAMSAEDVVGWAKATTTRDVTDGIVTAVQSLLGGHDLSPDAISAVMIGTTHFTNALVEGRRLVPTAVVRLGLPATKGLPPFIDWPDRLREVLGDHVYLCHGGHEFDGRLISPIDHDELRAAARDIVSAGSAVRDGLAGASETIRPSHFSVASAIGARSGSVISHTASLLLTAMQRLPTLPRPVQPVLGLPERSGLLTGIGDDGVSSDEAVGVDERLSRRSHPEMTPLRNISS